MIEVPIVLAGYGEVGKQYAELVRLNRQRWRNRYGVDLRVVVIRGREAQTEVGRSGWIARRERWRAIDELGETLARARAGVLAQAVPSNGDDRAAREAVQALRHGAHVVTATKSHLISRWTILDEEARSSGRSLRISAATGAALPAGDLARSSLRGFEVQAMRGCLSGTATYVLDRLSAGDRLVDAVTKAQRLGIAEADPRADLSGMDAATKMSLLTGLLWGWEVSSIEVRSEPITERARPSAAGFRLRQVASADLDEPGIVTVRLSGETVTSTLGRLMGPEKAVSYDCGEAGEVAVSGGLSSPRAAALAMVKDTFGAVLEPSIGLG